MYTAYTHIQLYAFNLIVFATAMWNGQPVKIIVVIRWVKINAQNELVITLWLSNEATLVFTQKSIVYETTRFLNGFNRHLPFT